MHGGTINKVGKAGSKKTGTVLQKMEKYFKNNTCDRKFYVNIYKLLFVFLIL